MKKILVFLMLVVLSLTAVCQKAYAAPPVINQVYDQINSDYVDRPVYNPLGYASRDFTDSNVKSVQLKRSSRVGAPNYGTYAGTLVTGYHFANLASMPLGQVDSPFVYVQQGQTVQQTITHTAGTTYEYEETTTIELGVRYTLKEEFNVGISNILDAKVSQETEVNASIAEEYGERYSYTYTETTSTTYPFVATHTGYHRVEYRALYNVYLFRVFERVYEQYDYKKVCFIFCWHEWKWRVAGYKLIEEYIEYRYAGTQTFSLNYYVWDPNKLRYVYSGDQLTNVAYF
jgi:hypothetical protein